MRIVRTLEGTPDPTAESGGSEIGLRVVRPVWQEMQSEMMERLDSTSIEALCREAAGLGIDAAETDGKD